MLKLIFRKLYPIFFLFLLGASIALAADNKVLEKERDSSLTPQQEAKKLGWISDVITLCKGYFLEAPFHYFSDINDKKAVEVTGASGTYEGLGTSTLKGNVVLNRYRQQVSGDIAYLYRDVQTLKLEAIDLMGNVHLREPNTLIIGNHVYYEFNTEVRNMSDVLYRTALITRGHLVGPVISEELLHQTRKITALTAWGKARHFSQTEPKVYHFKEASYSTCNPLHSAWRLKASSIHLDKNTGKGQAWNARLYVKEVPVFYTPYFSFPLDRRRKSGFLWPSGGHSDKWGAYVRTPFYWNMAPNYDMTLTPSLMSLRGFRLYTLFRYLTEESAGHLAVNLLPYDQEFEHFKEEQAKKYKDSKDRSVKAELNRLLNSSNTRKSFYWRNQSQFNENWSSHVDVNYAGDDYFLRDFGRGLTQVLQNQLLETADIQYKNEHWNFMGRVQGYQTLHPIIENLGPVSNQYRRLPQLVLNGAYPDSIFGLDFFINNDATHFDIRKTPGTSINKPVGNRFHMQPGIALPFSWPYLYITPRMQLALTNYSLQQTTPTQTPQNINRAIPIFDIGSGLFLTREIGWGPTVFQQTLEPQIYYTYIPYQNQDNIPIFDTSYNSLSYEQIFNFNRFSGIDRIGDANQIGMGITSRLIDSFSGLEKVRLGLGQILYFENRRVTLCDNPSCTDNPDNPENHRTLSPFYGMLNYHVSDFWSLNVNTFWNPVNKQMDNATIALHYQPEVQKVFNLGYNYARNGDPFSGLNINNSNNNLKSTDLSMAWPITGEWSSIFRWTHDWNTNRFQNLLYGVQYDTCCWAVRIVGGQTFTGILDHAPVYNKEIYLQFSLKGLGEAGSGNPKALLATVSGYQSQFGEM